MAINQIKHSNSTNRNTTIVETIKNKRCASKGKKYLKDFFYFFLLRMFYLNLVLPSMPKGKIDGNVLSLMAKAMEKSGKGKGSRNGAKTWDSPLQ